MKDPFEALPLDLPGGGKSLVEFNLRLWSAGGQPRRPLRVDVQTELREANAAGLPAGREPGDLLTLHEQLESLMKRRASAKYAMRVTGERRQTNIFYIPEKLGLLRKRDPRELLEPAIQAFGDKLGRPLCVTFHDDPDWSRLLGVYSVHDPEQWVMDRQMLVHMAKKRDAIHAHRSVAHRVYLPGREAARDFLREVRKLRFKGEGGPKTAAAGAPGPLVLVVVRSEPTIATWHLHPVVLSVKGAALRHGGVYHGWETELIPSLEPPPLSGAAVPPPG